MKTPLDLQDKYVLEMIQRSIEQLRMARTNRMRVQNRIDRAIMELEDARDEMKGNE